MYNIVEQIKNYNKKPRYNKKNKTSNLLFLFAAENGRPSHPHHQQPHPVPSLQFCLHQRLLPQL